MKWNFVALVMGLPLVGCTTTYQTLKLNQVKPTEGVAIGRVFININGATNPPDKCGVCFNSQNGPCYQLNATGLVFASLPAGRTTFRRIACTLGGNVAHYNFDSIAFENAGQKKITYFGDVNISWDTEGASLAGGILSQLGAGQPVNDFKVTDNHEDVINGFKGYQEPGPEWTYTTHLIKTKPMSD